MIKRLSGYFIIIFFLFLFNGVSTSKAQVVDKIVAIVNGEIITLSDLNSAGKEILRGLESTPEGERERREIETKSLILDRLIEAKLIGQAAKNLGIKATEKEVEGAIEDVRKRNKLNHEGFLKALSDIGITIEEYRRNIESEITQSKFMSMVIRSKVTVSKEELEYYYDRNKAAFIMPPEVRLGQILFLIPSMASEEDKEAIKIKAGKVLEMIRGGGSFEELASKFSEGPAADAGGDLGYVKEGEINPDIEEVVFNLKKGKVSDLIETPIGFHIFKILDIKEGSKRAFSEVKKEIENILFKEKMEETYQEWLEEMKDRSYIEVRM